MQSLLILERETGAIIRATGAITRPTSPDHPLAAEYAAAVFRHVKATEELVAALEAIDGGVLGGVAPEKKPDGELAEGPSDDVRLCTIRTRRRELLLVPGELCVCVGGFVGDADVGLQMQSSSWSCSTIHRLRLRFVGDAGWGRGLVMGAIYLVELLEFDGVWRRCKCFIPSSFEY